MFVVKDLWLPLSCILQSNFPSGDCSNLASSRHYFISCYVLRSGSVSDWGSSNIHASTCKEATNVFTPDVIHPLNFTHLPNSPQHQHPGIDHEQWYNFRLEWKTSLYSTCFQDPELVSVVQGESPLCSFFLSRCWCLHSQLLVIHFSSQK